MSAITAYQQALRANEQAEQAWDRLRDRLRATATAMDRARPSSFLGTADADAGSAAPFRFAEWPSREDMIAAADALGGTRAAVAHAWAAIDEHDRIGLIAPPPRR